MCNLQSIAHDSGDSGPSQCTCICTPAVARRDIRAVPWRTSADPTPRKWQSKLGPTRWPKVLPVTPGLHRRCRQPRFLPRRGGHQGCSAPPRSSQTLPPATTCLPHTPRHHNTVPTKKIRLPLRCRSAKKPTNRYRPARPPANDTNNKTNLLFAMRPINHHRRRTRE
jgi:hypothetical protein